MRRAPVLSLALATAVLALSACQTNTAAESVIAQAPSLAFEKDRRSILAMTGDYKVTFDFTETVALKADYELKEPKVSGGYESVRVVEDRGDFISLQHILVVGPKDNPIVVKHWRQDWQYEPSRVLKFIGGNAWEWSDTSETERTGAWSQTVYQVDDAPRYGAVARWTYKNDLAEWTPPREWRPLPRRDMTTRDDYHAVDAVNRHVITPWGWVHEQDNTKLVLLGDEPDVLVREVGVNTYRRDNDYPVEAGEAYWAATGTYWAGIRAIWTDIENSNTDFAITLKGETEDLYRPLLKLASQIQDGETDTETALIEAETVITRFVTSEPEALSARLRQTTALASVE